MAWLALLVIGLATIVPVTEHTVAQPTTPAFIADGTWRRYVGDHRTVVTVPLPAEAQITPMLWSADSGLAIALPRGYFLGPDPRHDRSALFGAPPLPMATLLAEVQHRNRAATVRPADRAAALADLRYWRAGVIVILPGTRSDVALRETLTQLLGVPPHRSGGVWSWDVRHLVPLSPPDVG